MQEKKTETQIVRVGEKGQITLPSEVRRTMGVTKGDVLGLIKTEQGYLLTPIDLEAALAVQSLKKRGIDLGAMIEAGKRASAEEKAAAGERLLALAEQIWQRNQYVDPDQVVRDVTEVVEEVEQEMYAQEGKQL